jgi:hypothetical protein
VEYATPLHLTISHKPQTVSENGERERERFFGNLKMSFLGDKKKKEKKKRDDMNEDKRRENM